jgi:protein-tyrosine phosphatase
VTTQLYWIDATWPGRLAIMPRPRGDDWLEDEVRAWKQSGIDVVVSLLAEDEIAHFDLGSEAASCRAHDIEFLSFAIADGGVPSSREAFAELLSKLSKDLIAGKNVAIHCRQGIGRAALVAISVLLSLGVEPEDAIQRVTTARGCPVPETPEQRRWILDFGRTVKQPITR